VDKENNIHPGHRLGERTDFKCSGLSSKFATTTLTSQRMALQSMALDCPNHRMLLSRRIVFSKMADVPAIKDSIPSN